MLRLLCFELIELPPLGLELPFEVGLVAVGRLGLLLEGLNLVCEASDLPLRLVVLLDALGVLLVEAGLEPLVT